MTIREELAGFNRTYTEALASRDRARLASLYTEDAVLLETGQPLVRGPGAIAANSQAPSGADPIIMTFETGDVWEAGNLVVDVGAYVIAGERERHGKYVVVYRRQDDGSLKLLVDAPSDDS